MLKYFSFVSVALACFISPVFAIDQIQPEKATHIATETILAVSDETMVVTAHPLASQAAHDILKKGGNAADALVAAQLVLGLVEPQSSGLGGGGFLTYYDASSQAKTVTTLDGRERAPAKATPHHFLTDEGNPMGFFEAALSPISIGVPAMPKLLAEAHDRFGVLEWVTLFETPLSLAEEGVIVGERLASMLDEDEKFKFLNMPQASAAFYPEGEALRAGDLLVNLAYKDTLELYRDKGADTFYTGLMADRIYKTVFKHHKEIERHKDKAILSRQDFESYKIIPRDPVCAPYKSYKICGMGEPSSGPLTVIQIVKLMEGFDFSQQLDAPFVHLFTQASRLAFADRNYYMADPDFTDISGRAFIEDEYIALRRALMDPNKRLENVEHGVPIQPKKTMRNETEKNLAPDTQEDLPGTTHIVIKDKAGNIASMTSSIETAFGSHYMVGGFLLNNQLTDFSFRPDRNGQKIANRVEGGKRPRSSMSPLIVFDDEAQPVLAIGSAGGARIIPYVALRLIAILDWGWSADKALAMPNIVGSSRGVEIERASPKLRSAIQNYGHRVTVKPLNSGLTALHIKDGKVYGAADPRREGVAIGE